MYCRDISLRPEGLGRQNRKQPGERHSCRISRAFQHVFSPLVRYVQSSNCCTSRMYILQDVLKEDSWVKQACQPGLPANLGCAKLQLALTACSFTQAVRLYSEALETDSTLAAAYNNRALAHLKLNNLADAEADCGYVLRLEPRNVKAFLRRGSAR